MVSPSLLIRISMLISCILAVYALSDEMDTCFATLEAISIIILALPGLKHLGYTYSVRVLYAAVLIPLAMLVLVCIGMYDPGFLDGTFWNTSLFTYAVQSMQTAQAFVTGLMIMIVVSKTGGFRITKRWMILAAMFFALAYGVLCMFGYFIGMYFAGDEVFNKVGGYVAQELNALMMSTCFTSTFVSAISAFIAVRCTRSMVVDDFTGGDGVE